MKKILCGTACPYGTYMAATWSIFGTFFLLYLLWRRSKNKAHFSDFLVNLPCQSWRIFLDIHSRHAWRSTKHLSMLLGLLGKRQLSSSEGSYSHLEQCLGSFLNFIGYFPSIPKMNYFFKYEVWLFFLFLIQNRNFIDFFTIFCRCLQIATIFFPIPHTNFNL